MKTLVLLMIFISIACNNATAENEGVGPHDVSPDTISIGLLAYGGTGCPDGSIVVQTDSEKNSLNLQFDQYTAAGGGGDSKIGRKSCGIVIPVTVPLGFQVGIVAADYQGYVSLGRGGQAQLRTEYFIAGNEGIVRTESYLGETSEEVNIHHESPDDAIVWTPCGEEASNIRVNTSVLVQSGLDGEEAVMSLDQAALIQLVLRACPVTIPVDQSQIDI